MNNKIILPNEYQSLTKEESIKLDGGINIPRWSVALTIDAALLATPLGAGTAPLKFLGKKAGAALIRKMAPKIAGAAGWALRSAAGISINLSQAKMINLINSNASSFTSVGGIIAFLGDYGDGKLDGRLKY